MPTRFMLAALLLWSFIACNRASQSEAVLDRSASPLTSATPDTRTDNAKILSSNMDTTMGVTGNNVDEQLKNNPGPDKRQAGSPAGPGAQPASDPDWDKKIVKTANLNIEVKNYKVFNEVLHRRIRESGGYIAQEEQNDNGYKIENSIMIKVPVGRFEETVMQLAADSDKILVKKISTEDVSMQLVDTRSRLETKKEMRQRYMEILRHAGKTEDIINAQQQIDGLQEQLEGAAGRIAYLGHAAAYSTINLVYYQIVDLTVRKESEPSFLRGLKSAVGEGWSALSTILIGLVSVWPLWLAAGLGWMGWKKWRRTIRGRADGAGGNGPGEARAV